MRGKVDVADCSVFQAGITPAHAGKSTLSFHMTPFTQDHPRACGEKRILFRTA